MQDPVLGGREISNDEQEILKKSLAAISQAIGKNLNDNLINILLDISRFRQHLKYTRFAHRIFNRMSILKADNDIELSKQARTLFQMHCADEIENDEAKIVHHTIMKADVRGSTVVTEMLEKKILTRLPILVCTFLIQSMKLFHATVAARCLSKEMPSF